jgi:hypothetical protein
VSLNEIFLEALLNEAVLKEVILNGVVRIGDSNGAGGRSWPRVG